MPDAGQHSVKRLAAEIEPHAEAAWPPRETSRLDGWLLRFGEGHSSRLNSVSALNYTGTDLIRSIEAAEAAYRARHLPPLFHISPANDPPELEAALGARGYTPKSDTLLMIADIADIAAPRGTAIFDHATADFEHLTREGSHSIEDGNERLTALARVEHPKALVVATHNRKAVACGASVCTGAWASVFVMRTTPPARRQGHGRRVLDAIAHWARQRGARRLYLQVDHANEPAIALYERAGFRTAYRYLHYVAPMR
ncbi:MAG: GNAT family N-acetyltransferase [Alphaproteobacteria bacterium]|nr:GNAT family N-acetyltransferase [Alphaproteobacteria bacterium]